MHVPFVSNWIARKRALERAEKYSREAIHDLSVSTAKFYEMNEREEIFSRNISERMDRVVEHHKNGNLVGQDHLSNVFGGMVEKVKGRR